MHKVFLTQVNDNNVSRALLLSLVLMGLTGCANWTPEGTYEIVQIWQGGSCGLTTPRLLSFSVTSSPNGDLTIDPGPGITLPRAAAIFTDSDECSFSFMLFESPSVTLPVNGMPQSSWNFTDQDGVISGAGMLSVSEPDNCTQIFDIRGTKIE